MAAEQPEPSERIDLAAALGFTADDLAANRAGQLSAAQDARLRQAWRRQLIVTVSLVIALMFGATFALFFGQRNDSAVLSFIGILLTVINAGVVGLAAQAYLRVNGDRARGGVLATSGAITRTLRVVSGRVTVCVIKLGGDEVIVSKPVFNAFEEGGRYTLYRTPISKTLLSAEPTN
jgi:hypothetical protein